MLESSVSQIPAIIGTIFQEYGAQKWERNIVGKYFKPKLEMMGDVALLPIEGAITKKAGYYDVVYMEAFDMDWAMELLDQVESDRSIKGLLVDFDTPGGGVNGVPEFSKRIKAIDKKIPVFSYTGDLLASAGYWMASGSRQIIASESAPVGSIGVYTAFYDQSELYKRFGISVEVIANDGATYKGQGVPGTSISKEFKAHLKDRVNATASEFKGWVTSNRPQVKAEAMQGQTMRGKEAKSNGLIDRIGSREFAISLLRQEIRNAK